MMTIEEIIKELNDRPELLKLMKEFLAIPEEQKQEALRLIMPILK